MSIAVSIATILTSDPIELPLVIIATACPSGDVQVARPIGPDASELRSNVYVCDYGYVYA